MGLVGKVLLRVSGPHGFMNCLRLLSKVCVCQRERDFGEKILKGFWETENVENC